MALRRKNDADATFNTNQSIKEAGSKSPSTEGCMGLEYKLRKRTQAYQPFVGTFSPSLNAEEEETKHEKDYFLEY